MPVIGRHPEEAVAAADDRLVGQRPGEAAARRDAVERLPLARRVAVDAGIHQAALQVQSRHLHRERRVAIEADGERGCPWRAMPGSYS